MSKFIKLLKTTLEKYGYIPSEEKGEDFNELIKLFEEKDSLGELLDIIESEKGKDSSSSTARLLRGILREGKIKEFDTKKYCIKQLGISTNDEHFDATLIDIFFEFEPISEEKELLTKTILDKSDLKFPVIESLLIHVTKYYTENDILFCDVYLRALSSKRGTYLGVHWFQDAYIRIAKSPELSRFIETITSSGYEKAFELFIEGSKDTLRLFFENIPPTDENLEVIKNLLTKNSSGEDSTYILSHYHGYNQKVFLDAIFNFLSKSGKILLYIEPFLGGNYGIYETREYVGNYIHIDEVSRLGELLGGEKRWGIMPIYEYIKSRSDRTDKEKVLAEFEKIPGFDEEMEKTRLSREKYEQEEKERIEKQNNKTLEEIRLNAKIDTEDSKKISPLLVNLYKKHKELFTREEVEIVKEHILRFFAWELFPLDEVEFSRTKTSPGSYSYSYTNNIWYREGFFLDTLEIAKELKIPYPSHNKLVRALGLLWIGDGVKQDLIPAIGNLTKEDIEVLGKVYDGSRTDALCEFMGGQNFFELYRTFESDWKREKDILRRILYAFIEKHEVEDYIRENAIELLTKPDIWNEEIDKIFIGSLWENKIKKYPENIIENYDHKYGYLLSINQILINLGDEDAIKWRFDQLLSAKVDFLDPWENYENNGYARGISDIESELTDDKIIIKGLENISFENYNGIILQLLGHGLNLVNENKVKYGIYGNYLIGGILTNWATNKINQDKLEAVILSHQDKSDARRIGGYKIQEAKKRIGTTSELKSIEDELDSKNQELKELKAKNELLIRAQNWNPDNPYIVFIEGKTGVEHLQRAWKGLYPDTERKFHIANGHSAEHIREVLKNWDDISFKTIIGIFDADFAGLSAWNKLETSAIFPRNIGDIGYNKSISRNKKTSIYGLTIPIHINCPKEVRLFIEIFGNTHLNDLGREIKSYSAIEEMYYGIPGIPEDVFDEYGRFISEASKNPLGWHKGNILEKLLSFTKGSDKKIVSEYELFKNFIPLFEKINIIIDSYEKSNQTSNNSKSEKSS